MAGGNHVWLKAVAPVQVRFRPTYDVAGYRKFARDTDTEWVIEALPTRLPVRIGQSNPISVDIVNRGPEPAAGELTLKLDPDQEGIRTQGELSYQVAAESSTEAGKTLASAVLRFNHKLADADTAALKALLEP